MIKARHIYIFEGDSCFSILRGYEAGDYDNNSIGLRKFIMKNKNLIFSKDIEMNDIKECYIGKTKPLFDLGKKEIRTGWDCTRIKLDLMTKQPYFVDTNTLLLSKLESLQHELVMWKRRCFEAENNLITLNNKDKLHEKIKEELKFQGEAKSLVYGSSFDGGSGYYGSPFASRWGLGGSSFMPPRTEDNE